MSLSLPTAADLTARLTAEGFTIPGTLDLNQKINAAIDWWEIQTGWHPFFCTGAATTRTYDPPGSYNQSNPISSGGRQVLILDTGLLSTPTITVAGVAKTIGTDFWQMSARGRYPQTCIVFASRIYGAPGSIAITAKFGYCLDLPFGAFEGILNAACSMVAIDMAQSVSGGVEERRVGDVMKRYGSDPLAGLRDSTMKIALQYAKGYQRVMVGAGF